MSTKTFCDLCGEEIKLGIKNPMYKLDVSRNVCVLSEDCGSLELHDKCMRRLDRIMEHCRSGKMARFDEVLQSLET